MRIILSIILILSTSVCWIQTFTDSRDGQQYKTVKIGELIWFAENLNFNCENSYCYDDNADNCLEFGRLYRWEAALAACPSGWHLSTEFEWQYLESELGMVMRELQYRANRGIDEGGKMKEGGESGLNLKYAGWRRKNGEFSAVDKNAALWTATESDLDHAWHRDIDTGDDFSYRSRVVKSYALSVRCVKDFNSEDLQED